MEKENRCSIFRRKPANRHRPTTTGDGGTSSQSASSVNGNQGGNAASANATSGSQGGSAKTKITRNPFINFLMEYRKKHTSLSMTESTKEAARTWNNMDENEKAPYFASARAAPKKRRRMRRRRRYAEDTSEASRHSTSLSRSRSRPSKRPKKMRDRDRKRRRSQT